VISSVQFTSDGVETFFETVTSETETGLETFFQDCPETVTSDAEPILRQVSRHRQWCPETKLRPKHYDVMSRSEKCMIYDDANINYECN